MGFHLGSSTSLKIVLNGSCYKLIIPNKFELLDDITSKKLAIFN